MTDPMAGYNNIGFFMVDQVGLAITEFVEPALAMFGVWDLLTALAVAGIIMTAIWWFRSAV